MKKSTYVFIYLFLSVSFWKLTFLPDFLLHRDVIFVLTLAWALLEYVFYTKKPKGIVLDTHENNKPIYYIFAGVFISMCSAYIFWGQPFLTTAISQRFVYAFIMLPALLYVRPSERDIIDALGWISIATIGVWCITIVAPELIGSISEDEITRRAVTTTTDLGFNVAGIHYVVFFLYFKTTQYIQRFSWNLFFQAMSLVAFLLVYQNRIMLIGVVLVLAYSLLTFKSKYTYKWLLFGVSVAIAVVGIGYTWALWVALAEQTQRELGSDDYARWQALFYYLNDYSPSWFCYIFGNGMPSGGNSSFGLLMWADMARGIYASDLGMLGMWTTYGLLPLIGIYSVVVKILIRKNIPFYLKFICFHICLVPTIFSFWSNPECSSLC
jgi:hypothetical protein